VSNMPLVVFDKKYKTYDLTGGSWTTADPYWIASDQLQSHLDLLQRIAHLSGKVWFTGDHVLELIKVWSEVTGLSVWVRPK
jgi:hypothetical protein